MGGNTSSPKTPTSEPTTSTAGDGIKSIRTTNVFKAVNFELYVKPNIAVMTFGVVAIVCSAAYLAYMKASMRESKTYVAIGEDGSQQLTVKKSRWE